MRTIKFRGIRIVVPRTRLRTMTSACALIQKKKQNTLASSSWNCGRNTLLLTLPLVNA